MSFRFNTNLFRFCDVGVAIRTTPCMQTNRSLSNRIQAHNFLFGTTATQSFTFSTSHFFSGQSWHASSSSIVLYLWLGARRPTAQSYNSSSVSRYYFFLGETLPPRTFHVKINGQSAVSTRVPTTLQHPLEKQVMSSQELRSMCNFLHTHLQEPDFCFGSQVTCFSRDPSRQSTGSYVPFL